MRKNPIDDALAEIMDAWMDIMAMPRQIIPKYAGIEIPSMRGNDMGDFEDKNGEITLTVDMPGVEKKDIELNVDTFKVSVKAETEERDYSFEKRFETMLNPNKVTAKFNNGVLDIKIQKDKSLDGKKIAIK